jgi:hypothetical protein
MKREVQIEQQFEHFDANRQAAFHPAYLMTEFSAAQRPNRYAAPQVTTSAPKLPPSIT